MSMSSMGINCYMLEAEGFYALVGIMDRNYFGFHHFNDIVLMTLLSLFLLYSTTVMLYCSYV